MQLTVEYKYDALERRIEKSIDGTPAERYALDGQDVWADLDGSSSLTTRYVHGDEVDQWLARIDDADEVEWLVQDRLGSVREILDGIGMLTNEITYDGFGNLLAATNVAQVGRIQFTGREYDFELGLQYNRDRYVDLDSATWTTEDRERGEDTNPYRVVGNNPTNATDPEGRWSLRKQGQVDMSLDDQGLSPISTPPPMQINSFRGARFRNRLPRRQPVPFPCPTPPVAPSESLPATSELRAFYPPDEIKVEVVERLGQPQGTIAFGVPAILDGKIHDQVPRELIQGNFYRGRRFTFKMGQIDATKTFYVNDKQVAFVFPRLRGFGDLLDKVKKYEEGIEAKLEKMLPTAYQNFPQTAKLSQVDSKKETDIKNSATTTVKFTQGNMSITLELSIEIKLVTEIGVLRLR